MAEEENVEKNTEANTVLVDDPTGLENGDGDQDLKLLQSLVSLKKFYFHW